MADKMNRNFFVFIRFGMVGAINTIIDLLIYSLLMSVSVNYLIAQFLSYFSGILNSYFMNRSWTFQRRSKGNWIEFLRFLVINSTTLLVTMLLLPFFYQYLGWSLFISKIGVTAIGVGVNFIGTRFFVFTEEGKNK